MSGRSFEFRRRSRNSAPDRTGSDLGVAWRNPNGAWEAPTPDLTTPGFRLYLLSLLLDPAGGADEQAHADAAAIEYIRERMRLCPVSRNLREGVSKRISLDVRT
jgi:hypothetical protein